MSRIGKLPIEIPSGVTAEIKGNELHVKGPKGSLVVPFQRVNVTIEGNVITVTRPTDHRQDRAFHGLYRALFANAITGVSTGFKKEMQIVGMGWRAEMNGKNLVLHLGYSHPVEIEPPEGITFQVPERTKIVVEGIDKQVVGQVAADIRKWRRPEPYKGKGIRYVGEHVRQKAGKAGVKK